MSQALQANDRLFLNAEASRHVSSWKTHEEALGCKRELNQSTYEWRSPIGDPGLAESGEIN
jgi:hypothetical protein